MKEGIDDIIKEALMLIRENMIKIQLIELCGVTEEEYEKGS